MPRLSQWMVKAAFVYLLLGFTMGALLLMNKGVPLHPALWGWLPVHIEFLLLGWIVQLTMGVAFWILPRFWEKPARPRANFAVGAFVLLNVGIWLVVAGTTFRLGREVFLAGRVVELAAVVLFGVQAWGRIVSREGR
jgi:hypothetical protein